jgi:hypothetical protein
MYSKEELKKLRMEFWEKFGDYTKFYSLKIGEPIKWTLYKTGVKGLELKFELHKKHVVVCIEVNHKSEDRRLDIFIELEKYSAIINEGFGDRIEWLEEEKGFPFYQIAVSSDKLTFHNKDKWPEIYSFMAQNMWQLQTNLLNILEILQERFKN